MVLQAGRAPEAANAIKRLWGKHRVDEAMADLTSSNDGEGGEDSSWKDLFSRRYRKGEPFMCGHGWLGVGKVGTN